MSLLDDLERAENINIEEILSRLLNSDNIELKSHIVQPLHLTILKSLTELAKLYELKKTAQFLDAFILYYLKYMVSYNRLSREEIIRAVSSLRPQPTLTISEQLTGKEKK